MKINKKSIALIAGLICLILVVVLLLTMCNGGSGETDSTEPEETKASAQENEESTQPGEEETVPSTETPTEPAAEETEPEETTEPTEAPTVSGNTRPGGTGGYNPGTSGGSDNIGSGSDTSTPEEIKVSDPGTKENPYQEAVTDKSDSFTTVNLSGGNSDGVYYNVYDVAGDVLTIEDETKTVVLEYNGKSYTPDEATGILTVQMEESEENTPAVFCISSTAVDSTAYQVCFSAPAGSRENPEVLSSIDEISMKLEEGNQEGLWYQWTADAYGVLTVAVQSVTPEDAAVDLTLTNGEQTGSVNEDGSVSIEAAQGDVVTIHAAARPNEDGTCPAVEIVLAGTFEETFLYADSIPFVMETKVLEAGKAWQYQVFGVGDTIMTIESPSAYVIYNGVTYGAKDGVVTVPIGSVMGRNPAAFTVGNGSTDSTQAESYTITFTYPEGSAMNPADLVMGQNSAAIAAGNLSGYWYTWTAPEDGTLNITVSAETGWFYVINNMTAGVYGDAQYSDTGEANTALSVSKGDEIQLNVNTFDPADMMNIPAGTVTVDAAFTAKTGTESNPIAVNGEFPIVTELIPAGGKVYYTVTGAANLQLTIEDADAWVLINGQEYRAANGVVTAPMPSTEPASIVVCNGGTAAESYTLSIAEPPATGETAYQVILQDYEENPVADVQVQFLNGAGEVAGEAITDASGRASATLERGSYRVVPVGWYCEDSTAVVTDKITSLEMFVTKTAITATEFDKTWTYNSVDYGGYNVSEGGTYVELTAGTHYFMFQAEEAGTFQITTSDPEAVISYWGLSTRKFADKSAQLEGYDKNEGCFTDNTFTLDLTTSTCYIGITCEEDNNCILVILPLEEEETLEETADTLLSEEEIVETDTVTEEHPEVTEPAPGEETTETEPEESEEEPEVNPEEPTEEPAEPTEPTEPAESTEPADEPEGEPAEPTEAAAAEPEPEGSVEDSAEQTEPEDPATAETE